MSDDLDAASPEPSSPPGPWRRRLLRGLLGLLALALVVVLIAAGVLARRLHRSLPQLEGERVVAGLAGEVRIERDALGVVTLKGSDRAAVLFGLGFAHAQDRYFQMDLGRRLAAGELAELLGEVALPADRENRVHRFRSVAREVVAAASPEERAQVDAYVAGVNAGLEALEAPPFEYLVFRGEPTPWTAEDVVLVAHAMFLGLQDSQASTDSSWGLVAEILPLELAAFLDRPGTEWDAPLTGAPFPAPAVPGPEVFDLSKQAEAEASDEADAAASPGSNNWALAGSRTKDGRALLANDMHLGLSVPNTWYRASFVFTEDGEDHRIDGATLPGNPMMVVGSNGRVAWGLTNSYADFHDLVELELDPDDETRYRTPDGYVALERHVETLAVRGGDAEELVVESTRWGPVVGEDHQGRRRALAWSAHRPGATNFASLGILDLQDVDDAVALATRIGSPGLNVVLADSGGRIAWTIMGRVPRRFGFDGRHPSSWADGTRGWDGWLPPEEHPRVVDPADGQLWTANSRTVSGEDLRVLGDGGLPLGARALQIRDVLTGLEQATEADMLALQLDDRALFVERWRELLLSVLDDEAVASSPLRAEARRLVEGSDGRASATSVAHRIVRFYRFAVERATLDPLLEPCREADEGFRRSHLQHREGAIWDLVTQRPPHLLDPEHEDWDALLLASADQALEWLTDDGEVLAEQTWGKRNALRGRHPISRGAPVVGRWLDLPKDELPGDSFMPRVQSAGFGASQRMVVSPGREEEGIYHQPGGQSGHPGSPYYLAGHEAWVDGEATPFLPGATEKVLVLRGGE